MPHVDNHYNTRQRSYFSGADRKTIRPVRSAYVLRHLSELVSAAGIRKGERVLEVGAGMGRFTLPMHEMGIDVTATDLSGELIRELKVAAPGVESLVCDVTAIPDLVNGPFDKVVGFFMLHHLEDMNTAFKSFAKVLKPGGFVAFSEPNAYYPFFYLQILLSPEMKWMVDGGVVNMRPRVLLPAMEAAGFIDIKIMRYGFFPPFIYNLGPGRAAERFLEALPLPGVFRAFQVITGRVG
jgi:SAM-dependent methyltransferase